MERMGSQEMLLCNSCLQIRRFISSFSVCHLLFPILIVLHNARENETPLPVSQATQWQVKWLEATRNDEMQKFSLLTEQTEV